jgi:hypothetical protein
MLVRKFGIHHSKFIGSKLVSYASFELPTLNCQSLPAQALP